jgi:hypothetical protein
MHEGGQGLVLSKFIENREVKSQRGVKNWEESWKNFLVREIDAYPG